jgi:hypothetical protein
MPTPKLSELVPANSRGAFSEEEEELPEVAIGTTELLPLLPPHVDSDDSASSNRESMSKSKSEHNDSADMPSRAKWKKDGQGWYVEGLQPVRRAVLDVIPSETTST